MERCGGPDVTDVTVRRTSYPGRIPSPRPTASAAERQKHRPRTGQLSALRPVSCMVNFTLRGEIEGTRFEILKGICS